MLASSGRQSRVGFFIALYTGTGRHHVHRDMAPMIRGTCRQGWTDTLVERTRQKHNHHTSPHLTSPHLITPPPSLTHTPTPPPPSPLPPSHTHTVTLSHTHSHSPSLPHTPLHSTHIHALSHPSPLSCPPFSLSSPLPPPRLHHP